MDRCENSKNGLKWEVRFDLNQFNEESEGKKAEEEQSHQQVMGQVQERYAGFFELPDRCVPFESTFPQSAQCGGFPAVFDGLAAISISANTTNGPKSATKTDGNKKKSLFAQHFDNKVARDREKKAEENDTFPSSADGETIKNLEVMQIAKTDDDPAKQAPASSSSTAAATVSEARYAMDPVSSDLATKCMHSIVLRKERQLVQLFDALGTSPYPTSTDANGLIGILRDAKRNIQQIRPLYLEQIQLEESGQKSWRFARTFVDPFCEGSWTLSPIRRVLDALQQRESQLVTADDVNIVRLALQWTVLLLQERPLTFHVFVPVPADFYCRLAELYLMGPEVFTDRQISDCVSLLLSNFLIDAARKGQLDLRLQRPVASLDAFKPFYEDLLQRFEDFSSGDDNFALLLLIGAYMNVSSADALLMAQMVWSPKLEIVRQITLSNDKSDNAIHAPLIDYISDRHWLKDDPERIKLLAYYELALAKGAVVKWRNPVMFEIARRELGSLDGRQCDHVANF